MIVGFSNGDILQSHHQHIVFGINAEGINTSGFAGLIASKYWNELTLFGPCELGDMYANYSNDRIFHAIVCHSLSENGWLNSGTYIKEALDSMYLINQQVIGMVLIGAGAVGTAQGANVWDIVKAAAESNKLIDIWRL